MSTKGVWNHLACQELAQSIRHIWRVMAEIFVFPRMNGLLFWETQFSSTSYQKYNQKWFLTPLQKHFALVPSSAELHFFLHRLWILYSYDFKPLSFVAWSKHAQSSPEFRQHRDSMKLVLPTLFSAGASCQAKHTTWPIALHDLN